MVKRVVKPMFVMGGGINYLLDNNSNKYVKITTKGKSIWTYLFVVF